MNAMQSIPSNRGRPGAEGGRGGGNNITDAFGGGRGSSRGFRTRTPPRENDRFGFCLPVSRPTAIKVLCRYGAECSSVSCRFQHPSERCLPDCRMGLQCPRRDCYFTHPPGWNPASLPQTRPCRYGADCRSINCMFDHPAGHNSLTVTGGPRVWGPGTYKWKAYDAKKSFMEHYELTLMEGGSCTCRVRFETGEGQTLVATEDGSGTWAHLPAGASGVALTIEAVSGKGPLDWRKRLTQLNDVMLMNFSRH